MQTERLDGTVSGITQRTVTTAPCPPDTAPPALLHPILVDPAQVDVGGSPAVVTMRIGANDGPAGSGPGGGTWTVSYGQGQSSTGNLEPTGDPNVWEARVHVWQGAPTGTWSLTRVTLRDKARNEATYSHGPFASFQVASSQPDFTIHLPAGATVQRGTRSPVMWITIRVTRGFTGTITLGARVRPGFGVVIGPPGSVDGRDCDQNAGECRVPFYVDVAADMEPRLYALEIVGTLGALERTEYIDVLVTP